MADQARLKAGKSLHLGKEKELQTFQKRVNYVSSYIVSYRM